MTWGWTISHEAKIKAIKREIALRRRVYPKQVDKGDMHQTVADYEIKVMEEILKDYENGRT